MFGKIRKTALLIGIITMFSLVCGCASSAAPAHAPEAAPEVTETPAPAPAEEETKPEPVADAEESSDAVCTLYLGGAEDATSGMEQVDDTFNDDGSYRYEYVNGDGMIDVREVGKLWNGNEPESPEDKAIEMARWILHDGYKSSDETVKLSDEYTANTSYPVYIVSFLTGSNEDTWSWKAFTVATDTCGLVYAIGGPADFDEDSLALANKVFPKLRVIDKDEGLETNDGTYMSDLFDYFGAKIDDVAFDFPELQYDDSYKTAKEGTTEVSEPAENMETMSDGFALAGPFFTIDTEDKVVGINYGGRTYCLSGIKVGMPMSEAAELAKSHGFSFERVDITHGSAKYVLIYDNGETELYFVSDADGNTSKMEESDVTGNVDSIAVYKK